MQESVFFRLFIVFLITCLTAQAKHRESTYQPPDGLVYGAAFKDLFLPVPLLGKLRSDTWGAENVIPRDIKNGIEDPAYSYWGGNMIEGEDGKQHLFVCRWSSNERRGDKSGHRLWPRSEVVHAISENPLGPFEVIGVIGKGHNPEIYKTKDGTYFIGIIGKAYRSQSLDGPWELIDATLNSEMDYVNISNKSYVPREDGSVLMINKQGHIWISDRGDENFRQVTTERVYPSIAGAKLEDPVIWRDEVQYHLIVNDWLGRTAFYMRSPDGIRWKWAPGIAYDPQIMRYEDGTPENWYKFERPKVVQDPYGRATHMNFAVIDVVKDNDLAGDNHSSKNVVIPLTIPCRLEIINSGKISTTTEEIHLRILAEDGFDPTKDVDLQSLRFGASEEVDFGRGSSALRSEESGGDLVVVFGGARTGLSDENFAAKLLGQTSEGDLLFGYAKI
ncbi:MAG: glycoside hydrolase family protein [Verrucomicrobiota bacterium]